MKNTTVTVHAIGPKKRGLKVYEKIAILTVVGLAAATTYEKTGPKDPEEGMVVGKRISTSTSNGSTRKTYKIEIQLKGAHANEVVVENVSSWDYNDFDKGDTVVTNVGNGRLTGWLQSNGAVVKHKK